MEEYYYYISPDNIEINEQGIALSKLEKNLNLEDDLYI